MKINTNTTMGSLEKGTVSTTEVATYQTWSEYTVRITLHY